MMFSMICFSMRKKGFKISNLSILRIPGSKSKSKMMLHFFAIRSFSYFFGRTISSIKSSHTYKFHANFTFSSEIFTGLLNYWKSGEVSCEFWSMPEDTERITPVSVVWRYNCSSLKNVPSFLEESVSKNIYAGTIEGNKLLLKYTYRDILKVLLNFNTLKL